MGDMRKTGRGFTMSTLFRGKKKNKEKFKILKKNPYKSWKRVRTVGRGGYANVDLYRKGKNEVAIKMFDKMTEDSKEEFELEIKGYAAAGDHENLAHFITAFKDEFSYNIVLEYYPEGPLTKIYEEYNAYTEADIRDVIIQCSKGLEFMLGNKVIHRDVKSENILVKSWNPIHVVLTDLNFSIKVKKDSTKTVLGTVLGTDGYKAPEIEDKFWRNDRKKYNYKVDVFALGIVGYELVSNEKRPSYKLPVDVKNEINLKFKGKKKQRDQAYQKAKVKHFEKMVEEGVPLFPADQWKKLSQSGIDVLSTMILPIYDKRPSYDQIINSDWGTTEFPKRMKSIL